jgi:hypothetical protein
VKAKYQLTTFLKLSFQAIADSERQDGGITDPVMIVERT